MSSSLTPSSSYLSDGHLFAPKSENKTKTLRVWDRHRGRTVLLVGLSLKDRLDSHVVLQYR